MAGSGTRSSRIPRPSPRSRAIRWTGTTRPFRRGARAERNRAHRIALDEFTVDGLGIRCVDDRPWVTGAETCELVIALDSIGERRAAAQQFAAMQHLREHDGSYWTGWFSATEALARRTDHMDRRGRDPWPPTRCPTAPGSGIFRGLHLPRGLEGDYDCECVTR